MTVFEIVTVAMIVILISMIVLFILFIHAAHSIAFGVKYKLICGNCRSKFRATIQNMGSVPDCPYCEQPMLIDAVHIPLIKRIKNVIVKAKNFRS
jgi:hypothetical protein